MMFPTAPDGTKDVLDFLRNPQVPAWVAGRVRAVDGQTLSLESREAFLELSLESPFHGKVGDIICCECLAGQKVQNLKILVSSEGEGGAFSPMTYATAQKWTQFLQLIRNFFVEQDFVEVQTPQLVVCPGTEPFLHNFQTQFEYGRETQNFYLPTSPELHLKKSLVKGWTKVFEIQRCFRNGELSSTHQAEFSMLEWYRAYATIEVLQKDFMQLLEKFKQQGWLSEIPEPEILTMGQVFQKFLKFELTPLTTLVDLKRLANEFNLSYGEDVTWDDLFHYLLVDQVEHRFKEIPLLFLHGYPPTQGAFSRMRPDGWADRFEIYWNGVELANAFHELNDPEANIKKMAEDLQTKASIGYQAVPLDPDFFAHLFKGMPPASGIALGVDRLFMVVFGLPNIDHTRLFPMG